MSFRKFVLEVVFVALSFLSLTITPINVFAESSEDRSIKIKAAIVFHIAKFVQWQTQKPQEPLKFCYLEENQFIAVARDTLQNKKVQGRAVRLIKIEHSKEAHTIGCDMIIYSKSNPHMQITYEQKILSVCESILLSWDGCMIQVFEQNNKARIAVDVQALKRAGLNISSELLALAIVRHESD